MEAEQSGLGCGLTQSVGRDWGLELKSVYLCALVWSMCLGFLLVQLVGLELWVQEVC